MLIGTAGAADWYVNEGDSIQAAVNNATDGDTIIVRDGTYQENVDVDKQLTIRSENGSASCIVNASNRCDHVFEISEDSVILNGFTVQNATGYGYDWKKAGIHIESSNYVNISDCVIENNKFGIRTDYISWYSHFTRNIVRNNTYGIYLYSSPYATLTENSLSNNCIRNLGTSGTNSYSYWHKHTIDTTNTVNGKPIYYYTNSDDPILENLDAGHISLVDCTNATVRGCSVIGCDELRLVSTDDSLIEGNTVCDTEYAIRLLYSSNNIVRDNTANDNDGNGNGIRVQYGVANWIENNTLKRNYMGVYVEGCENITIINNSIEDNSYGCWLYDQNRILNNTIQGSGYHGLNIMGDENQITGNTILDNGDMSGDYGISLSSYSNNNTICNNYLNNTQNARDDGTNIWNTTPTPGPNIVGGPYIGGNYWSDYTGTDGDGDGFGEASHDIAGGANQDHLPLVHVHAMCGDVDGNITVDAVDLQLLLAHVFAGVQVADERVCDVDGSGAVNILDARLLMHHIADPGAYPLNCTG